MREKRALIVRNIRGCLVSLFFLLVLCTSAGAQYYPDNYYNQYYNGQENEAAYAQQRGQQQYYQDPSAMANLQYEQRDAEMILREQAARSAQRNNRSSRRAEQQAQPQQIYDDYYGHRVSDEGQVQQVMAEARNVAGLVKQRNGKSFIVMDKRNFQFYLFDKEGRLLRIGPVAIGKGKTGVGAFETPVGVFPIKNKTPVDDWIRPDWYFIEEGEPIPQRWEDRRVPGFFRYKLVFEGSRYIHYAEATGGRLTHGCLGLDWQDAEAVFHTLQVGSYCIIIDQPFLTRLARGEFPVQKQAVAGKPARPEEGAQTVASSTEPPAERTGAPVREPASPREKVLNNLW